MLTWRVILIQCLLTAVGCLLFTGTLALLNEIWPLNATVAYAVALPAGSLTWFGAGWVARRLLNRLERGKPRGRLA